MPTITYEKKIDGLAICSVCHQEFNEKVYRMELEVAEVDNNEFHVLGNSFSLPAESSPIFFHSQCMATLIIGMASTLQKRENCDEVSLPAHDISYSENTTKFEFKTNGQARVRSSELDDDESFYSRPGDYV